MAEYLTEQEQIELLKKWIKRYSLVVILGVAIAFAFISGWRYWQGVQEKKLEAASLLYDEMLTLSAQNNAADASSRAIQLYDMYPKTAYGEMGVLFLAQQAVNKQNYIGAKRYLTRLTNDAHQPAVRQIARIRLSRILIADNKPSDAIDTLKKVDDEAFLPLIHEIRGDAWLKANNPAKARTSYQEAIQVLPNAEVVRPLLIIKFDNLATSK